MKSLTRLLACCVLTIAGISTTSAQTCVDPLKTLSYDTLVTGSGNASHTFSFPKFDAAMGTLMEVTLSAEITLLYSFQLENRENITISNYRVRVFRDDEVSSSALMSPITNSQIRTYGSYSLTAWDGVAGSGTDYTSRGPLPVMNHAVVSQTVYNTADYLGVGNVDFDYLSTTYSSVLGSVNYTYNATAVDSIVFRLTYTYCPTWFLKADISSFHASKRNNSDQIELKWTTHNEEKERVYEIEKSFDGRSFETVASQVAQPDGTQTGHYRHTYTLQTSDRHPKLIFRLKEKEKNGDIRYSALRVVDIKQELQPVIRLYPNPSSSFAQVVFNNTKRGYWKTELISLNGAVVKQYTFNNALTGRIDGLQQLPKGLYLVKATEQRTGQIVKSLLTVN